MSARLTVWVTKYALTKGVYSIKADLNGAYAYASDKRHRTQYPPGTWFRTEAEALARAEEKRLAKIKSLKKQLAKLEKNKFG